MMLTACAKMSSIAIKLNPEMLEQAAKKVTCEGFKPIEFSATKDTAKTIVGVRGHNAAWVAVCRDKTGEPYMILGALGI